MGTDQESQVSHYTENLREIESSYWFNSFICLLGHHWDKSNWLLISLNDLSWMAFGCFGTIVGPFDVSWTCSTYTILLRFLWLCAIVKKWSEKWLDSATILISLVVPTFSKCAQVKCLTFTSDYFIVVNVYRHVLFWLYQEHPLFHQFLLKNNSPDLFLTVYLHHTTPSHSKCTLLPYHQKVTMHHD